MPASCEPVKNRQAVHKRGQHRGVDSPRLTLLYGEDTAFTTASILVAAGIGRSSPAAPLNCPITYPKRRELTAIDAIARARAVQQEERHVSCAIDAGILVHRRVPVFVQM